MHSVSVAQGHGQNLGSQSSLVLLLRNLGHFDRIKPNSVWTPESQLSCPFGTRKYTVHLNLLGLKMGQKGTPKSQQSRLKQARNSCRATERISNNKRGSSIRHQGSPKRKSRANLVAGYCGLRAISGKIHANCMFIYFFLRVPSFLFWGGFPYFDTNPSLEAP